MQADRLEAERLAMRKVDVGDTNRFRGTATFDRTRFDLNKYYESLDPSLMDGGVRRYSDENIYKTGKTLTGAPPVPSVAPTPAPNPSADAAPKPQGV